MQLRATRLTAIATAVRRAVAAFTPLSLFASGAPGVWYDPSDLTTLFQDSAGTTPVTAVEQPVGLMLDKSQGLVLGSELITPEANRDFSSDTGYWTKGGATAVIASGACTITNLGQISKTLLLTIGKTYKITYDLTVRGGSVYIQGYFTATNATTSGAKSFILTATSGTLTIVGNGGATDVDLDNISVKELPGNHAFQATSASRPVLSARVNKLLATATLATQSVTTRAAAHTLRFEGAGSITLSGTATGTFAAGSHSVTATAGTLTLTVSGSVTSADLRETNDGVGVPAYQAVVTSTNYNTTGFLPYLRFDGVDDSLSTNSISFTATDKMSVFAGVRKLSDAAGAILVELSSSYTANTGSFFLSAPNDATTQRYGAISRGNAGQNAGQGSYVTGVGGAPDTANLTALFNISGDSTIIRRNGTAFAAGTADQGTGNYGNYPLYLGRRGGPSLPFNGQMYSMIIVGKAVTAGELSSTETYVNQKTGAY